ncbi:hypothetical protein [Brevibacillus sp. DP1.3A]|uniref:hypothetical protein n=1 Tax=Brevibacillus sp. DP1.3A TaxID=2738867 RepID=UPI00156A9DB1|nr:hypothetical protein [Brevibacillus sp. DP1.3A]UED78103.1 hypothetical protein HP399_030730 [Brevibacillus sp. DP1.3A]
MDQPSGKLSPIELQMILDDFINRAPFQIKYFVESAKVYKARFDSLVAAGFTEVQALEIVKTRGLEL